MLFASNGPLSVKDIQTAFARFHEQAASLPFGPSDGGGGPAAPADAPVETPVEAGAAPAPEAAEVVEVADDELYRDVPSLITSAQIREAMATLALEWQAGTGEIVLVEGAQGWRLATHPRFARWVRLLRNEPPEVRLTPSAIETLAVVAYRQPVTRAEIEQIRGVSADAGLAKLLERDLVYVVGRAELPGRPIQYGTTDGFLEFVGLRSLDELPSSDVLSPRQIDSWLQAAGQPRAADDGDMGLDETEPSQMTLDQAALATPEAAEAAPVRVES